MAEEESTTAQEQTTTEVPEVESSTEYDITKSGLDAINSDLLTLHEKIKKIEDNTKLSAATKYEKEYNRLNDFAFKYNKKLRLDQELLDKLQSQGLYKFYNNELKDLPISVENTLSNVFKLLEESLGRSIDDLHVERFNPMNILSSLKDTATTFANSLEPMLKIPALPTVPVIGDLNQILDDLQALYELQNRIPDEVKEKHKKKKAEGGYLWGMIPPEISQQIDAIMRDLAEFVEKLPMLMWNILIAMVSALWDIVKKVLEVLGITEAGFPLNLLDQAKELGKAVWDLMGSLETQAERILMGIVEKFMLFELLLEPSLDDQFKIDTLSCEIDQINSMMNGATDLSGKIQIKGINARKDEVEQLAMLENYIVSLSKQIKNIERMKSISMALGGSSHTMEKYALQAAKFGSEFSVNYLKKKRESDIKIADLGYATAYWTNGGKEIYSAPDIPTIEGMRKQQHVIEEGIYTLDQLQQGAEIMGAADGLAKARIEYRISVIKADVEKMKSEAEEAKSHIKEYNELKTEANKLAATGQQSGGVTAALPTMEQLAISSIKLLGEIKKKLNDYIIELSDDLHLERTEAEKICDIDTGSELELVK